MKEKVMLHQQQEHYIVAIGASAGGLEAIHEFFDNMPESDNLSFIIIQHLSPDYKSLLVELISKHTRMEVYEAMHDQPVQKNCVYVIPNDKLLTISHSRLQLGEKNFDRSPNTAIDTFLRSLAKDKGSNAIAVILSGTGTDGTRGIEAIQQSGGLIIVQDPESAKFNGMPNSAIAAGYADFVLSPAQMPEEIFNYVSNPERKLPEDSPNEESLPEVLQLVEKNCGHDFTNYKTPTILRRITRRMNQLGYKQFNEYLTLLRDSPSECKILGSEFLIGVTKFFRDSAAFDILAKKVLPIIVQNKEDDDVLKVWVTACSTGEEAYGIAILLNEIVRHQNKRIDIKLFATDIDGEAIEEASKGAYKESSVSDINPDYLRRYFIKEGSQYTIIPQVRKQIVFARHNLLKDPPFIKNDLVSCRNMLIYMNASLQRKVLHTLQYSLNIGGYLFLGPSEIPSSIAHTLSEVDSKWKIYEKTATEKSFQPARFESQQYIRKENVVKTSSQGESTLSRELSDDFRKALTEEFKFAAVYIDKNYEIKEAVGDFRTYLSLPQKISSLNILKMVPHELSVALTTSIRKSEKENKRILLSNVKTKSDNKERYVDLYVQPSPQRGGLTVIIFGESHTAQEVKYITAPNSTEAGDTNLYIAELQEELKDTQLNLQMAVESLETTNEELQSSNEELLSSNEELQSSNEELQSLNEELHTLNTEHQLRIQELVQLNDDLNNYFRSTNIAQLFVDSNMRIRKFNPAAIKIVNLIDGDIGRPIEHISTNLRNEDILPAIANVMENNTVYEKEVQLLNGTVHLLRIQPYVRLDKHTDGVVVTFIDITKQRELNSIVNGVFNSSISAILALKAVRKEDNTIADFICTAANYAADEFLNKEHTEYINKPIKQALPALLKNRFFEKCVQVVKYDEPLHTEMIFDHSGKPIWYEVMAKKMDDGIALTFTDIDEKKLSEEKLKKNLQELVKAKESLRQLNTDLESKIKERTRDLSDSEERFRLIANATSDVVWDWNLVNNHIWWSDSFFTLFGFDKDEIGTHNHLFWIKNIHADDRERVVEAMQHAINDASKSWSAKYRFKKKDGSYALVWDKGAVITDDQGISYRMVGSMTDITQVEIAENELKIKHSELQTLFDEFKFVTDFMPQMVWATQPDGYHNFYNKQWYDYTGLTYEQTKDTGWNDVVHPDDKERAWEVWRSSLETGEPYEIEYRFRKYDGTYRWFLGRALPLKDENGKILKWFGTCTDIHDQKLMTDVLEARVQERTQELQKSNADLEAINVELQQFTAIASHDLKEPLRKIQMFSNIIQHRFITDNNKDLESYLTRIVDSAARMTRLINDLLDFSRLSSISDYERVDLGQTIKEVFSDLELLIHEKKAKVSVDPLPEIQGNSGQMRQVFQNLISNALKFNRKDVVPEISITAERIAEPAFIDANDVNGPFLRIRVCDNGIGFDEKYIAKIFTIFQRLHTRDQFEGTGIGLAITKKIIEKHNGLITAQSKENEGSCFIIILPIRQQADLVQQVKMLEAQDSFEQS